MAKGGFPGFGGNIGNLMKQAQKMQEEMKKIDEQLENEEYESTAGGGAVTVLVTGKKSLKSIKIKPEVVDPDDVETLEDLVMAAVNEAFRKAEEAAEAKMGKITGGAGIPGLF